MMIERYGIGIDLCADDERYPTLVLEGPFGKIGYSLNKESGELDRICICFAHSSSECMCGGFDQNLEG